MWIKDADIMWEQIQIKDSDCSVQTISSQYISFVLHVK
jgi:hypothetical protein